MIAYTDAETAASAVRNLNDVEVGGRPLRLDFAEVDPMLDNGRDRKGVSMSAPTGMALPPGVSATDAITQTIASLPPQQLMDILVQMKSLTATAPEQARSLLVANPQLAYAVFHAMLMMNVVDPAIVQHVLSEVSPALDAPQMGAPMPPGAAPQPSPHPAMAAVAVQPPPPPMAAPVPTAAAPQPPQAPKPAASNPVMAVQNLDEQQRQLLQQVLQLTPAQINALPPDQRASIMQLKAQFGQ